MGAAVVIRILGRNIGLRSGSKLLPEAWRLGQKKARSGGALSKAELRSDPFDEEHLFGGVNLVEFDFDDLAAGGWYVLADVGSFDG